MKALLAVLGTLAFVMVGTACSSACDDMKECCEAYNSKYGTNNPCDAYDDADSDDCEKARDVLKDAAAVAQQELPAECDF